MTSHYCEIWGQCQLSWQAEEGRGLRFIEHGMHICHCFCVFIGLGFMHPRLVSNSLYSQDGLELPILLLPPPEC